MAKIMKSLADLGLNGLIAIYGPGGTGKSSFCLQSAFECISSGKKVLFLDTASSFSVERLKQISGNVEISNILDKILVLKIKSFKDQLAKVKMLDEILKKGDFGLVVIDPITYFYRRMLRRVPDLANRMLITQLKVLKEISKKMNVAITSEVYSDLKYEKIKMVGDSVINKRSDFLIELKNNPRKLTIKKPEKKEFNFKIGEKGFEFL